MFGLPWFIQLLITAIVNWRDIYSLLQAIGDLLRQIRDKKKHAEAVSELAGAVKEYAKSRNKRPLEEFLCKLKGECENPQA